MQKTSTFLMFVGEQCGRAEEAVELYVSLFDDSSIDGIERWGADEPGGNEGEVKVARFTLTGRSFMASDSSIPHQFNFTPSSSTFVECDDETELDTLYLALAKDGAELMPLADYGIGRKFGWVNDRFGVSWQLQLG